MQRKASIRQPRADGESSQAEQENLTGNNGALGRESVIREVDVNDRPIWEGTGRVQGERESRLLLLLEGLCLLSQATRAAELTREFAGDLEEEKETSPQ